MLPRPTSLLAVALGAFAALAIVPPVEAVIAPHEARADDFDLVLEDVDVGTELVAITDVRLHNAEIAKGSRVSVRKLDRRAGRVAALDVELADGHIVPKVQIRTIRTKFRVASND
jgi:hypothetical protein